MNRAKWQDANLQPERGYGMLPSLYEAVRYRGLILYAGYDVDSGSFWDGDWELIAENTGQVVVAIHADEERAYEIATKLAEMLDWSGVTEADWKKMSFDPVFVSFLAEHFREVAIPITDVDALDGIVPYADRAGSHRSERPPSD